MKIKDTSNKLIAWIEAVGGGILVILGTAIIFNKWVDNAILSLLSFLKRRPPAPQWPDKLHLVGEGLLLAGALVTGLFILPFWDRLKQSQFSHVLSSKWERIKQNKAAQGLAPVGAALFITGLITVSVFSFNFIGNELDILPSIRQFVEHAWLPNDWYLNLNTSYRALFGFLFGPLVSWLGFENGAYVGRLIAYLLVAISLYYFFRALQIRPLFGILVLMIFLNHQSLVAGEWMVGGLETKTIAYAMVFLSLSFFLRKRYIWGFVFAGAALSFHVLIGIYALFCLGVAFLLNAAWRTEWRLYARNSWPLPITGFFGVWAVVDQLLPQKGLDTGLAWRIYVEFLVPQHVLPKAWSVWNGNPWAAILAFATVFFLLMYFLSHSKMTRFVAAFSLGSVFLFLVGLVINALGKIALLRFYWFRFPDVMVPFMGAVLIALFLSEYAGLRIPRNTLIEKFQSGLQTVLRLAPAFIAAFLILILVQQTVRVRSSYVASRHPNPPAILTSLEWISRNTPKQALFLADPSQADFYVYAQRAELVSWKSAPQSAAELLEWYKRIKACNGNADLINRGYNSEQEIHDNFYKLDQTQIQQMADQYGINYYLGLADQKLSYARVYSDATYAVYRIK